MPAAAAACFSEASSCVSYPDSEMGITKMLLPRNFAPAGIGEGGGEALGGNVPQVGAAVAIAGGQCRAIGAERDRKSAWVQRIHAVLFHQGAPALGEGALRTEQGLAALRAVSAGCLSPAGQLQVATALEVTSALEARLHELRHQLLDAARHLTGAKVLAARLYGVGPVTALAMTCWLAGKDRFSSSRKAVRFAGLDVTVHSSDRKGPPGRLSRQGPPVLRWAVYEAGKTHARSSAPDHGYYAQVKDRCNGKRAALSEARKILRQACHILAELGDDALSAA